MTTTTPEPRTHVTRLSGRLSQCCACGEVFGGEYLFDMHRAWQDNERVCRDPAELGLVILSSANGTRWGKPMPDSVRSLVKAA